MHRLKLDTPKAGLRSLMQTGKIEPDNLTRWITFAAAQTAMDGLKEFARMTDSEVPGLQEGLKALAIIFDAMQVLSSNCVRFRNCQ